MQQFMSIVARRLLVRRYQRYNASLSTNSIRPVVPCFVSLQRIFMNLKCREYSFQANNTKNVVNFFVNHLNMSAVDVKKVLSKHGQFKKFSDEKFLESYSDLLKAGFHKSTIRDNIWLLMHMINPIDTLNKISLIRSVNIDVNDGLSLLNISTDELLEIVHVLKNDSKLIPDSNRIHHLVKTLKCSVECACSLVIAHKFLKKISFRDLDRHLGILLDFGMSREAILKDVSLLSYREQTLMNRIFKAYYWGVTSPRPWVIRGPEEDLNKNIDKAIDGRAVYGSDTKLNYLYQQLDNNMDYVNYILRKKPAIISVNAHKLKLVFDLMYENNYTAMEIIRAYQIFFTKVDKLKERCLLLKKLKHKPMSPLVLCMSEQCFRRYINSLIRNKTVRFNEQISYTDNVDLVKNNAY